MQGSSLQIPSTRRTRRRRSGPRPRPPGRHDARGTAGRRTNCRTSGSPTCHSLSGARRRVYICN
eukprot:16439802-Heterocapsa_arctica.AAC.1